jgi:hypothetical protein
MFCQSPSFAPAAPSAIGPKPAAAYDERFAAMRDALHQARLIHAWYAQRAPIARQGNA